MDIERSRTNPKLAITPQGASMGLDANLEPLEAEDVAGGIAPPPPPEAAAEVTVGDQALVPSAPAIPDEATIQYAVRSYGFLLASQRQFTLGHLAQAIRAAYDMEDPRNVEVVRQCESDPGRMYSREHPFAVAVRISGSGSPKVDLSQPERDAREFARRNRGLTDNQRTVLVELHKRSLEPAEQKGLRADDLWEHQKKAMQVLTLRGMIQPDQMGGAIFHLTGEARAFVLHLAAEVLNEVHMSAGAGFYVDNCPRVVRAFGARVSNRQVEITPDHGKTWEPVDLKKVGFRYASSNLRIDIPGFWPL